MVRLAVVSSLFVAAEAGTLAVTWSDCGAKHATVTDLQPTSVETGSTVTLTGTGTVDEDVTAASFQATVSAAGAKLTSCSGDATSDIQCKLPLGAGTITVKALTFPLNKGKVSVPVEVKTSAFLPAALAKVDVHITATEQNGESVICLDVHTAKQMKVGVACTGGDQSAIKALDDNVFGDKSNTCGRGAYNVLTGKFNHGKFNSCMASAVGITTDCAECYAKTAEYGAGHCKADCILGWCKQGCLDCTAPAQTDLHTCTGIPAGSPKPCDEVAVAVGVACTGDDQSAIKALDDNAFGDKSNTCGRGAYNVLTGKFNHDKFNSCLVSSVGITTNCAECYAKTAEYGAGHCKADCILGWCKQGCLDCTAPAQTDLPTCTGIPAGSPKPCDEVAV